MPCTLITLSGRCILQPVRQPEVHTDRLAQSVCWVMKVACRRTHKEVADYARGVLPEEILDVIARIGAVPADINRDLTHAESHQLFPRLLRLRQVWNPYISLQQSQYSFSLAVSQPTITAVSR